MSTQSLERSRKSKVKSQKSEAVGAGFDQKLKALAIDLFAKPARTSLFFSVLYVLFRPRYYRLILD